MLPAGQPKFKRRKAARPDEIVAAAFQVFAEKGFAAARLDDIAARAGVSKGALYLYFETKEEMFEAVVERGVAPNLQGVQAAILNHGEDFPALLRAVAEALAQIAVETPLGSLVKMVVGEARNFPDLARVWHDRLIAPALGALTAAIGAAQARGELQPGDARQYAVSLIAPLLVGVIWRETFTPVGAPPFDLPALMRQHVELWLRGVVLPGDPA